MALDETIFRSTLSGKAPLTVRLYTWLRPTLSIGFRQALDDVCDLSRCGERGIDVVRRMTGGRAVLHHDELTYCVAGRAEGVLARRSVRELYGRVTGVIRAALAEVEIPLDPPPSRMDEGRGREAPSSLPCFAVPTGHEITTGGRKLVGSAQKWSRSGFLQHGSILLRVDPVLWQDVTPLPEGGGLGPVGVHELCRKPFGITRLVDALVEAFGGLLGEPPSEQGLSPWEIETARALAHLK
ncbi:MAG: biotin/lipoate A/B protein ligase family protein, partial [Acidobacteriota bacterium]